MSAVGSDGQQQQMPMSTSQQMHHQMRTQGVIRQSIPVHMQQGQNVVRMQRQQMPPGVQMGQPVHVLQQGVIQPQSQGVQSDGVHNMPVGLVEQTRPVVSSYGPQANSHMQSVPMYPIRGPGQMRGRNVIIQGAQQPYYGQQVRISAPGSVQQQMTGNAPVRLIPSGSSAGGNISGMHMVSQPNQVQQQIVHSQQSQQPFMTGTDGQQQRMMVSQPRQVVGGGGGQGMKIIPTSQQQPQSLVSQGPSVNVPSVVRGNMPQSQMPGNQSQQQQQINCENVPNAGQIQNSPQIKPEQQQNFLHIVENAMKQLRQKHPDLDLKNYIMLKDAIVTGKIQQKNLPAVEKWIQRLSVDPSYLMRRQVMQQQQQQQSQNQGGSGGAVSEETRQKLAQKRNMQGQSIRSQPSSSSLNTLLSQPVVDHLGGPVSSSGAYNTNRQSQMISQQQQQQQQIPLSTSEFLSENPVDDFNVAMDKIADEMTKLRRKMGPVRAAQIDNEICEMARQTLEKSGHLLPRDVLPVPKSDRGSHLNTDDMIIGGAARLAELEERKAAKRPKYEEWPISVRDEDQLIRTGKCVMDKDLTFADLNPRFQAELEEMRKDIEEVEVTIVHPEPSDKPMKTRELGEYPDLEEMNDYDKIHSATEWNKSLHLRLNFHSLSLPCGVPPLYVCIPPAYLLTKNIVWMYRKSDFDAPQLLKKSMYNENEIASFRKVISALLCQFLDTYRILRRRDRTPISLYNISEIWAKGVLKSVLQFREFPA